MEHGGGQVAVHELLGAGALVQGACRRGATPLGGAWRTTTCHPPSHTSPPPAHHFSMVCTPQSLLASTTQSLVGLAEQGRMKPACGWGAREPWGVGGWLRRGGSQPTAGTWHEGTS